MLSKVDLFALGTSFKMPVYLVQGEHDLLTSAAVTRRYFDQLKAPRKELIVVPRAGHDPNQPLVDAQFKVLQERVRPAL
jgi:pimeloyl-ACP methyl ester carboxylesterase